MSPGQRRMIFATSERIGLRDEQLHDLVESSTDYRTRAVTALTDGEARRLIGLLKKLERGPAPVKAQLSFFGTSQKMATLAPSATSFSKPAYKMDPPAAQRIFFAAKKMPRAEASLFDDTKPTHFSRCTEWPTDELAARRLRDAVVDDFETAALWCASVDALATIAARELPTAEHLVTVMHETYQEHPVMVDGRVEALRPLLLAMASELALAPRATTRGLERAVRVELGRRRPLVVIYHAEQLSPAALTTAAKLQESSPTPMVLVGSEALDHRVQQTPDVAALVSFRRLHRSAPDARARRSPRRRRSPAA